MPDETVDKMVVLSASDFPDRQRMEPSLYHLLKKAGNYLLCILSQLSATVCVYV